MKSRSTLWIVLVLIVPAMAADWPQWRGLDRTGISKETGLLHTWPEGGPTLAWQLKDLGDGYSTPAVSGDRLYVQGNEGMENEYCMAIDLRQPKQNWKTRLGNVGKNQGPQYPAARGTPTIDGDSIYSLGSDGDLVAMELATGKEKWRKNLRTDFGGKTGNWAYAESPLIDGGTLVCTPGGEEATIVALNKKTGDVIWKSPSPGGDQAGYASIIIVDAAGVKQYVQFLQKGLVGLDAKTGKLLWQYDKTAKGSSANIPTPVAKNSAVYSAARPGGALVKLTGSGGNVEATEVYFTPKMPNAIGGTVEVDGYLYGTNTAGLMCVEFATGEVKWQNRCVGPGSVCFADGQLYVHGEDGDVALVDANPNEYVERGRFTPPSPPEKRQGAKAWAYPIIANGKLYLRDKDSLWCYDVKAK